MGFATFLSFSFQRANRPQGMRRKFRWNEKRTAEQVGETSGRGTRAAREKETRRYTMGARVQPVVVRGEGRGGKGKSETSSLETGALLRE